MNLLTKRSHSQINNNINILFLSVLRLRNLCRCDLSIGKGLVSKRCCIFCFQGLTLETDPIIEKTELLKKHLQSDVGRKRVTP
jgi:hypothetical protein